MAELSEPRQSALDRPASARQGQPAPPEPEAPAEAERVMTLVEHLTELRRRIFIAILAVAAGSVVGFLLSEPVIALLTEPIPDQLVYFTQPGGALFLRLKLAVMIGVALAAPVLLYHFWAFVSPGLTPRERRMARPWIPLALLLLALGVLLGYIILPFTVTFLIGFQIEGQLEPLITADHYFGFVLMMFLAFGLVMQFPILLLILAKAGIVSVDKLRRGRRYALLGLFIVAVVVTPQDPFSSVIMTLVMYPVYELTIFLVARSESSSKAADANSAEAGDG